MNRLVQDRPGTASPGASTPPDRFPQDPVLLLFMRASLLLLVVVLAFVAIRRFRGDAVAAAGSDEAPQVSHDDEKGAHFLAPIGSAPALEGPRAHVAGDQQAAAISRSPTESWPTHLVPSTGQRENEIGLAATLIHGTAAEVQAAAVTLPKDRALLLEAFAWELAGERQLSLALSQKIASKDTLDKRERVLFEAALLARTPQPASTGEGPVAEAMEMALLAREASRALEARSYPEAARGYSALLLAEIGAPWAPDRSILSAWTEGLNAAQREHRWNPRSAWPATELSVQPGDSLIAIRLRYLADRQGSRMCTGLIERSNRLKGLLQPEQALRIPTDPARVEVDLRACWALFLLGDEVAAAWPVGIGRPGEETPPGEYTARNKVENPPWMKEGQDPIPFGDPRNPLGTRWIGWSKEGGRTSYGFHGTWEPESIGKAASDGCVRLLNSHVEELFEIMPEGAPIRISG